MNSNGTHTIQAEEQRLAEAIHKQMAEKVGETGTSQLSTKDRNALPPILQTPFGMRLGAADTYTPVPAERADDITARMTSWYVELHVPGSGPVGFEILGDVVLGRKDAGTKVEIDLEPFHAAEKGVSRKHAMLHPSANALYLFDLNSTNGTQCNGLSLGAGVARPLTAQDTIRLGHLTFEIKVVKRPTHS